MSQLGSMDEAKLITKPLLPLSTSMKKKTLSSWLFEAEALSLKAAVLFGLIYAGAAAYNLRDRRPPSCPPCPCSCQCQEPTWFVWRYVLTGADVVDESLYLLRVLLGCSAVAAALALALLAGGRSRRGFVIRAVACGALGEAAASHWMYFKMLGLLRIGSPGDLYLAVQTACVVAAAALNLLGYMAFVLDGFE